MTAHRTGSTTGSTAIEIEQQGPADGVPFLLLRGLGTQLVHWPAVFIDALSDAGYRVVTFDNRDVGLSDKINDAGVPDLGAIAGGAPPPYTIADMAGDSVGVLDALGIDAAHVMGISMGGMIVQHIAASHPQRCLSMTSIMSSSGAKGLPTGTPEAMAVLGSVPDDPNDPESVITHKMQTQRVIESPRYPMDDAELRRYAEVGYRRCHHPVGVARQLAAVLADVGRVDLLAGITVPSMVVHGADDPLVHVEGGRDTARRIPGCRLEIIEGMGHDVTVANTPLLTALLLDHARGAAASSGG